MQRCAGILVFKLMKEEEIFQNLCIYDKRHPDYDEDVFRFTTPDGCGCDNCFYGRTELALEILRLRENTDMILNKVLNKALIGRNKLKSPDSNQIAQFVINYLEENDK